jgi:hypothetical protein
VNIQSATRQNNSSAAHSQDTSPHLNHSHIKHTNHHTIQSIMSNSIPNALESVPDESALLLLELTKQLYVTSHTPTSSSSSSNNALLKIPTYAIDIEKQTYLENQTRINSILQSAIGPPFHRNYFPSSRDIEMREDGDTNFSIFDFAVPHMKIKFKKALNLPKQFFPDIYHSKNTITPAPIDPRVHYYVNKKTKEEVNRFVSECQATFVKESDNITIALEHINTNDALRVCGNSYSEPYLLDLIFVKKNESFVISNQPNSEANIFVWSFPMEDKKLAQSDPCPILWLRLLEDFLKTPPKPPRVDEDDDDGDEEDEDEHSREPKMQQMRVTKNELLRITPLKYDCGIICIANKGPLYAAWGILNFKINKK